VIRVLATNRSTDCYADRHASESPRSSASSRPALGPPSAVADGATRFGSVDHVVVTPARILRYGRTTRCLRETLEVTATESNSRSRNCRERRVFHKEIDLRHPIEPEAVAATYRTASSM